MRVEGKGSVVAWLMGALEVPNVQGHLGRKAVTNLESVKSRDITLPAKVRMVKAMVFPVVMYGYESWTIKKIECQRTDALDCGVGEGS